MTTVLILGAGGMLGHQVYRTFKLYAEKHPNGMLVFGTVRKAPPAYKRIGIFNADGLRHVPDVRDLASIRTLMDTLQPNAVINCVGLLKPLCKDPIHTITINSLFPHHVAEFCAERSRRLLHISTDCVFSGRWGPYDENSVPDPIDLYGRSKSLGEVDYGSHLTVRASVIGPELFSRYNLLEWVLNQQGVVNGFANTLWSGLTTLELSKVLLDIALNYPTLTGILHVAGEGVSKYNLLCAINEVYGLGLRINEFPGFHSDRRLVSRRTDYTTTVPSLREQLEELAMLYASYRSIIIDVK